MNTSVLPILASKQQFQDIFLENSVIVLQGPTGSGKTSQIPVFLQAPALGIKKVVSVQPRRIAASSMARYVAKLLNTHVGGTVGYQIRHDSRVGVDTSVLFMTSGVLLRHLVDDPLLSAFDCIIVDEVHEGSIETIFILGMLKRILAVRPKLKVILMSATIDSAQLKRFFSTEAEVIVDGTLYDVETRFMSTDDQYDARQLGFFDPECEIECFAAYTVQKIVTQSLPGDILIFMPGWESIENTYDLLQDLNLPELSIFKVHGDMSQEEQDVMFDEVLGRRVIIATNVAETSITIPGISHVIDSGLIKQKYFDPTSRLSSIRTVEHSKSGLGQRKGRAGRVKNGIYWPLFTEYEYDYGRIEYHHDDHHIRLEYTESEMRRGDVTKIVLLMLSLGVLDPESFECLERPSANAIREALSLLKVLGAIKDDNSLTEIGKRLNKLPVDPSNGRMLLAAEEHGCVLEVATIIATLSTRTLFRRPKKYRDEADSAHKRLMDARGDFFTAIHIVDTYRKLSPDAANVWARAHFLNSKALQEVLAIRNDLLNIMQSEGFETQSIGVDFVPLGEELMSLDEVIRVAVGKAILPGLPLNVAVYNDDRSRYEFGPRQSWAYIHPGNALRYSSVVNNPYVVAAEFVSGRGQFLRQAMSVDLDWILESLSHLVTVTDSKPFMDREDNWVIEKQYWLYGHLLKIRLEPTVAPSIDPELTALFGILNEALSTLRTDLIDDPRSRVTIENLIRDVDAEIRSFIRRAKQGLGTLSEGKIIQAKIVQLQKSHSHEVLCAAEEKEKQRLLEEEAAAREQAEAEEAERKAAAAKKLQQQEDEFWQLVLSEEQDIVSQYEKSPGFGLYTLKYTGENPVSVTIKGDVYDIDLGTSVAISQEKQGRTYYMVIAVLCPGIGRRGLITLVHERIEVPDKYRQVA